MMVRSATTMWTLQLILLIMILICNMPSADTSTMHYVYWNTTSPIFRIDNTNHIIDVNKGNMQFEYDQVNIICPVYGEGTREDLMEKYIIYNVSKEEYDTCRITNPSPRVIAVCDKPRRVVYFTITFRSFTPQPGGLEFLPGQDYYFISTSSKDDLHRRIGGRCRSNHMKVIFKICCGSDSSETIDTDGLNSQADDGSLIGSSTTLSTTTAMSTTPVTPRSTVIVHVTTPNNTYYEVIKSSSTTKKAEPPPPDPGENEIARAGDQVSGAMAPSPSGVFTIIFISILANVIAPRFFLGIQSNMVTQGLGNHQRSLSKR